MKESEKHFSEEEISRFKELVKRTTEKLEAIRDLYIQENADFGRNKNFEVAGETSTSNANLTSESRKLSSGEKVPPLKLKISLQDLPHKCERILLLPEDITMRQLHFFIQRSVGWSNSHLFEFTDSEMSPTIRVQMPDDFDYEYDPPRKDAHAVMLKETFLQEYEGEAFWYNYDFGDDWWHKLSFLEPDKNDKENFSGFPVCLKAEGKCPPEDVGGTRGYAEFLEIVKDQRHPDYEETRIWAGLDLYEPYDELQVNLEEINSRLMDFFMSVEYELDQYNDI